MALSAKQTLFIDEYLKSFNATQAALSAGYSPKSACAIGWENLRKPEIAEFIKRRLSETAMSADEVLKRLADIARGGSGADVRDQIAALQLIGKNHKLFVEKSEVSGPNGGPIEYKEANEASERILSKLDKLAARIRTDGGDQRDSTNGEGQGAS